MGGGDLNLKKSWHPSTLKNQERVWKAEQQKQEEDKKIAELQRELKEERMREELEQIAENSGKIKKNENKELNWMYKGPGSHVSREEYLCGRKIDKAFEILQKEEAESPKTENNHEPSTKSSYTVEHEINPESVIQKDEKCVQVDIKRKLLEDPLLMIRQNEEATKKAITSNPVKMKQLQTLISTLSDKKKKKHKHQKKKKKKEKKKKEMALLKEEKRKKKKKHKKNKKISGEQNSKESSGSEESLSDEQREKRRRKVKKLIDREMKRAAELRKPQNEKCNRETSEERRDRTRDRDFREKSRSSKGTREIDAFNRSRSRSRSRERRRHKSEERSRDEELRKKREDMMVNASRRDAQRKENVHKYEEEIRKEEEEDRNSQSFVRKLGSSVASSVESRIKSKVSSLQKGKRHMNENFVRK